MSKSDQLLINQPSFYVGLVVSFCILGVVLYYFPEAVPFSLFQFFTVKWDWGMLWGIRWWLPFLLPAIVAVFTLIGNVSNERAREIAENFNLDVWNSVKAGIFEEVSFRWLGFLWAIIGFKVLSYFLSYFTVGDSFWSWLVMYWPTVLVIFVATNLALLIGLVLVYGDFGAIGAIFGGLIAFAAILVNIVYIVIIGWAWARFLYVALLIPVANWVTGGMLLNYLYGFGWVVGAAVLSVNAEFRDGHNYNGLVASVNAWLFGMLMYWIMFNFGLPMAMLVHAGYDVLIHLIIGLKAWLALNFDI